MIGRKLWLLLVAVLLFPALAYADASGCGECTSDGLCDPFPWANAERWCVASQVWVSNSCQQRIFGEADAGPCVPLPFPYWEQRCRTYYSAECIAPPPTIDANATSATPPSRLADAGLRVLEAPPDVHALISEFGGRLPLAGSRGGGGELLKFMLEPGDAAIDKLGQGRSAVLAVRQGGKVSRFALVVE